MPKPKILLAVGIFLVVIAILMAALVYIQADAKGRTDFVSNIGLNLVAEFIGMGIGIGIPLIIFAIGAIGRYEKTATQIAEAVAQLRAEGAISKEAARKTMVCAIDAIPKESISREANNKFHLHPKETPCDVCDLKVDIGIDNKCEHCGLEKHVWSLKNQPVIPASYSGSRSGSTPS